MAKVKPTFVRVPKVQIEAVRNGYRLKVEGGNNSEGHWYSGISISPSGHRASFCSVPFQTITPSGEYVFPDFAALSAWLRKNIRHGGGVTE